MPAVTRAALASGRYIDGRLNLTVTLQTLTVILTQPVTVTLP